MKEKRYWNPGLIYVRPDQSDQAELEALLGISIMTLGFLFERPR